jgi:hypothetical protein
MSDCKLFTMTDSWCELIITNVPHTSFLWVKTTRSRGSSFSIVSDYGLDDRGSLPGRGKICPLSSVSRPALRCNQPPIQWVRGPFPGGKVRPGHDGDHSPPSSAEVKNEQELYLFSPLAPTGRIVGQLCFTWRHKPLFTSFHFQLQHNFIRGSQPFPDQEPN